MPLIRTNGKKGGSFLNTLLPTNGSSILLNHSGFGSVSTGSSFVWNGQRGTLFINVKNATVLNNGGVGGVAIGIKDDTYSNVTISSSTDIINYDYVLSDNDNAGTGTMSWS